MTKWGMRSLGLVRTLRRDLSLVCCVQWADPGSTIRNLLRHHPSPIRDFGDFMKRLSFVFLWALSSILLIPISSLSVSSNSYADEAMTSKDIFNPALEALAKGVEKEFVAKNLNGVLACFDDQAWIDRIVESAELPQSVRETVGRQLVGAKYFESYWSGKMKQADSQTSFRFLKLIRRNEEMRALFRSVDSVGLTYLEMVPSLKGDGSVRFADIYDIRNGESSTFLFQSMMQAFYKGNSDLMRYNDTISQLAEQTDWNDALKLLDKLDLKYQSTKTVLLKKTRFNMYKLNFAKCVLLSKEYQKQFGNDESIDVAMVEPLLADGRHDALMEVLTRLENFTGPEPYLMAIRAICASQGRGGNDELKRLCEMAMEMEPTLSYAVDPVIQLSMKKSNFTETTRLIIHLLQNGNVAYVDKFLESISSRPYVDSEAYRDLLKWKNEQKPEAERIQFATKEQEAKSLQDKDLKESFDKLRSSIKAENYASGTKLLLYLEEKHNVRIADVFFSQQEMKGYISYTDYQTYLEKRPKKRP